MLLVNSLVRIQTPHPLRSGELVNMLVGAIARAYQQCRFPISCNVADGSSGSPQRCPRIYLLDLAHLRELNPQTATYQTKKPARSEKLTG